jgi:hypothetical protein
MLLRMFTVPAASSLRFRKQLYTKRKDHCVLFSNAAGEMHAWSLIYYFTGTTFQFAVNSTTFGDD